MSTAAAAPMREEWRQIPGSDGLYSASNLGRVRSEPVPGTHVGRQRGRILVPSLNRKGYIRLFMSLPSGRKYIAVHSAVTLAFIGPRVDGMQVNHKNGNKCDNRAENLEYVTCEENVRHAYKSGLCVNRARGEGNSRAKLSESQVRRIRALAETRSLPQIAEEFGITTTNASYIIRRMTWRHVA